MLFARSTAIALLLLAAASPVAAQEMFGGFFNRLIPGSGTPTPAAAPPPGPVVAAKPAEPPPLPADPTQTNPFNGGRGGLMGAFNGQDAGCTGVLCTFMGGERASAPPGQRVNRTQAELDAIDAAYAVRPARRNPDGSFAPPPEKRCVDTTDPWRCYR